MNLLYLYWYALDSKKIKKLLNDFIKTREPSKELRDLYREKEPEIQQVLSELKSNNCKSVSYFDKAFPKRLKLLEDPPLVLSYKGSLSFLNSPQLINLAFVGSRNMDSQLEDWAYYNFRFLPQKALVVSGGARGVDQLVHKEALRKNLQSLVVLPSGILNPYPKNIFSSFSLNSDRMLWISQFHPKARIKKYYFYPRNHLIAALSSHVFILQAHIKSGTMVTAQYAIDLSRDLYVLGAAPWDERYSGNLKLIQEGAYQIIDLDLFQ